MHFVKHCLKSKFAAGELKESDVKCVNFEKGESLVRSSTNSNLRWPTSALRIPNYTPNSKPRSKLKNLTPNSKKSLQVLKGPPNTKKSFQILKSHSES